MLASDNLLVVPSGRSLPAVFDRATGRLLHKREFGFRSTAGGVVGSVQALLADEQIYSAGPHHLLAMEQKTGDVGFGWIAGRQMVVSGDAAYVATGEVVARLNRMEYAVNSRRRHQLELDLTSFNNQIRAATALPDKAVEIRKKISEAQAELKRIADVGVVWQTKTTDDSALLAAGDLVFLGGKGRVTAYSVKTGESLWQSNVEGEARGLVVAGGHLLVSTNTGHVYNFASAELKLAAVAPAAKPIENPFPDDKLTAMYRQAAEEILKRSGAKRGYGLIVGNEQGRLAYELAKRSELKIYAVEADAKNVAAARANLSRAGLYGTRIVVHQADPANVSYSNYFANVIASDSLVKTGTLVGDPQKLARHLKPLGGAIVLGRPAGAPGKSIEIADATAWLQRTELGEDAQLTAADGWATLTRGALPGAGNWSHQYGNAANTAVSLDKRVKGDLGVLWFGIRVRVIWSIVTRGQSGRSPPAVDCSSRGKTRSKPTTLTTARSCGSTKIRKRSARASSKIKTPATSRRPTIGCSISSKTSSSNSTPPRARPNASIACRPTRTTANTNGATSRRRTVCCLARPPSAKNWKRS